MRTCVFYKGDEDVTLQSCICFFSYPAKSLSFQVVEFMSFILGLTHKSPVACCNYLGVQMPFSVKKRQNDSPNGRSGTRAMVKSSFFLPNNRKVVLSRAKRRLRLLHPQKESFQPTFRPVTFYITAAEVHQLRKPKSSPEGVGRGGCSGCTISPLHFTLRK